MLYGLDLFSGIGGITEALSEWVRPVAYCEIDRYAQGVLISRMAKGQLPRAPIWDDVTTLRGAMLPAGIDIIYGGFPCQDISIANTNGAGLDGSRSGLFYEIIRLVDEIRPRYVFLENVPNIVNAGLDRVIAEFAERRFDAQWMHLSAAEVGACHIRNRWWLLANTKDRAGRDMSASPAVPAVLRTVPKRNGASRDVTNTNLTRLEGRECAKLRECSSEWAIGTSGASPTIAASAGLSNGRVQEERTADQLERRLGWPTVPAVCGANDGIPARSNRIAALGNAVVPECAKGAFKILAGMSDAAERLERLKL